MLCASVVTLATSCGEDVVSHEGTDPVICPTTEETRALYEGSMCMAYPFFDQVVGSSSPTENIMVSPLSLTEVLAMLANGADGETLKQILKVMEMGNSKLESMNRAMAMLNEYLTAADKKSKVAIANSQWFDLSIKPVDEYVKKNELALHADTYLQDLSSVKTMNDINSWCDSKTNGEIKKILDDPLSDDDKVLLINALYFKGVWLSPFDKENTTDADFTNQDGTKSKVKMMNQEAKFSFYSDDTLDVVEIPYGDNVFCMDVILPKEGVDLNACLKELDFKKMDHIFTNMMPSRMNLFMPRMELKYKRRLNQDLKAMGMTNAFSDKADFTEMFNSSSSCISAIDQVTVIKVDEEGTVAAAVTSGVLAEYCADTVFRMDRPFAFLIREKKTGIALFMGRVAKM